jgi:predicted PurR-regulated permease PerM
VRNEQDSGRHDQRGQPTQPTDAATRQQAGRPAEPAGRLPYRGQGQAGYRLARLWDAAEMRKVPLRTIIVAILAVAFFYLAGKLIYRLRDVLLLLLVAGFLALILNPLVQMVERRVIKRHGLAVTTVALLVVVVFLGLLFAFGYPLVNAITHLANTLPTYVQNAEQGKNWYGKLVKHYHVQQWVQHNAAKLVSFGQDVSAPALAVGKGALSLLFELATIFVLVLLLLLEGPRLRRGVLSLLSPAQAREVQAIASEVNRAVVGYMLGNFLTSLICGIVVLVDLTVLGVPFPLLWALWVALVDFLPMIGGALAGIPVVIFAVFGKSLTAGIVTAIVFIVYTQIENHILNPVIMSKTVRISPLLVLISVLVAASVGSWVGGLFGGFVAALLAIPAAGAFQVITREAWRLTAPPPADEEEKQALIAAAGASADEAAEIAAEAEEGEAADEPDEPLDTIIRGTEQTDPDDSENETASSGNRARRP